MAPALSSARERPVVTRLRAFLLPADVLQAVVVRMGRSPEGGHKPRLSVAAVSDLTMPPWDKRPV